MLLYIRRKTFIGFRKGLKRAFENIFLFPLKKPLEGAFK
jgi:hypothetical protein